MRPIIIYKEHAPAPLSKPVRQAELEGNLLSAWCTLSLSA